MPCEQLLNLKCAHSYRYGVPSANHSLSLELMEQSYWSLSTSGMPQDACGLTSTSFISPFLPPFLPLSLHSLTALKVLVGILLLGKACKYCRSITMETTNQKDSEDSTDIGLSSHIPNEPESPLLIRKRARPPPTGARKHKPLSEVERYTLCSNRIV